MSSNLYEILGIQRDATADQVRKAYRKRALETHPDRVPPEEKEIAGDEFRKVNNAYEVLNDRSKRQAYDAAGVWPPPPPGSGGSRRRRRPRYSSTERHAPFTEDPHFDFGWNHAAFTDPFRIFESVFGSVLGELHNSMSDPFFHDRRRGRDRSFDAHHHRGRGFFDDHLLNAGFPFDRGFDDMTNPGRGRTRVYSQVSRSTVTPDGRFVSESKMTRSVNGVTESVWKRKDASGNEYATYTYPDGRERHTINGREQPPKHIQPQRFQPTPPPSPPPPIQTTLPPPPYSNISRKRESPTSASGRKRDSPIREHHSPIEILSSSHSGSPPPINHHHYRPPPTTVRDYTYAQETPHPHHKSRWWRK